MHLLVLTKDPIFPDRGGGTQRTLALVAALRTRHRITLASPLAEELRNEANKVHRSTADQLIWLNPAGGATVKIPETGSRARRLQAYLKDFFRTIQPLENRLSTPDWFDTLVPLIPEVDGLFCRHSRLEPLARQLGRRPLIMDVDDLPFVLLWRSARSGAHGLGSAFLYAEVFRALVTQSWVSMTVRRYLVASDSDRRWFPLGRISVVPNGVSIDDSMRMTRSPAPGEFVFVGHCGYEPNTEGLQWLITRVWPGVLASHPDARLKVVGYNADLQTLPFAAAKGVTLYPNASEVVSHFSAATVSLAPIFRGGGTRIKIIESLGYGTPVLSTTFGAEGLTDSFGIDQGLLVTDGIRQWIAALCSILENRDALLQAAERGRQRVREQFTWEITTATLRDKAAEWLQCKG